MTEFQGYNRVEESDYKFNRKFKYADKNTEAIKAKLAEATKITQKDLCELRVWSLNRSMLLDGVTLDKLNNIKMLEEEQITDDVVRELMDLLVERHGIGIPLASHILKLVRPDVFPVMDMRSYRAIYGYKLRFSEFTLDRYLEYREKVKSIAEKYQIDISHVDEQLYIYDKDILKSPM